MADLIVIEYDDIHKAEEVRLKLQKMERDYLVDLADAVVATKDEKGKVRLNQIHNLTASRAVSGGYWSSASQYRNKTNVLVRPEPIDIANDVNWIQSDFLLLFQPDASIRIPVVIDWANVAFMSISFVKVAHEPELGHLYTG